MIKKVIKGAAWAKAPRLMFAARNPRKAAVLKAVDWATGLVTPRRKRSSAGRKALQGLGAAAVALPIGLWVGRKVRGGNAPTGGRQEENGRP